MKSLLLQLIFLDNYDTNNSLFSFFLIVDIKTDFGLKAETSK